MSAPKPTGPPYPFPKKFPSKLEQLSYKTYNWFENRLWPIGPYPVAGLTALAAGLHYQYPSIVLDQLPQTTNKFLDGLKLFVVSSLSVYVPVFSLRAFLQYFIFAYKGHFIEKKRSWTTTVWGFIRLHILNKYFPPKTLESCDRLLGDLPVTDLEYAVEEYMKSMKYLLSQEEMKVLEEQAEVFLKNEGKKLQRYAWMYSLFTENYVTPLWKKYAYLYGRYPLLINSSVAHCDLLKDIDATRAHRAARIVWIETYSHLAVDRQQYKPLGYGMMCSRHYRNMYSVTRVPGETCDSLKLHGIQKHVVVVLRGKYYKVYICDDHNNMYTVEQLTKIFHELISLDEKETGVIGKVAALTHDRRDVWCKNRKKYFLENKNNSRILKEIESAIFFFSLDENDDYGYDETNPKILNNFLSNMLTGDGTNRWVDKSLNYICSKNARCGGTTEHSIADGLEFDHIMENFVHVDTKILKYKSMEEQEEMAIIKENEREGLKSAEPLVFEVPDQTMLTEIERCYNEHQTAKNDLDLYALAHRKFGKGAIKAANCSPDAFLQMAIQLAIYKDQGKFLLTYEPGCVRFYANSRTETLRSVTEESCEFVYAMMNENESNEKKRDLLRRACQTHKDNNLKIMAGKGIDRHLFVLYVLSQATNTPSAFLENYISQKWKLSTSHIPAVSGYVEEDTNIDLTWLGACFGPVASDGYGVCYRFGGDHGIFINITSYHSATNTNSERFAKHLEESISQCIRLFDNL